MTTHSQTVWHVVEPGQNKNYTIQPYRQMVGMPGQAWAQCGSHGCVAQNNNFPSGTWTPYSWTDKFSCQEAFWTNQWFSVGRWVGLPWTTRWFLVPMPYLPGLCVPMNCAIPLPQTLLIYDWAFGATFQTWRHTVWLNMHTTGWVGGRYCGDFPQWTPFPTHWLLEEDSPVSPTGAWPWWTLDLWTTQWQPFGACLAIPPQVEKEPRQAAGWEQELMPRQTEQVSRQAVACPIPKLPAFCHLVFFYY